MMSLPEDDRREALLATLESSGVNFSVQMRDVLESVRRLEEWESGKVRALTAEEAFLPARRAVQAARRCV